MTDLDLMVWPLYTLNDFGCGWLETHPKHFWQHPSGFPAICRDGER